MIGKEELLRDLIVAYKDARKRIRNRSYQMDFEKELETHLLELRDEIWNRTWETLPTDVFIVFRPVQREVFASQFRDRVVHHLLYNYIEPMMDKVFIRDSYSCRKGKGTSDGVERMRHHLASASHNYTRPAYLMKLDIQGYFMSIDKQKLYEITSRHLDKHWEQKEDRDLIDYLLKTVIFNDVTHGCQYRSRPEDWDGLPKSKSLFYARKGAGLPIGDLSSQLFSNIYLNELDQYVKRTLHCKHYGRYVDDFFLIDTDKNVLLVWKDKIERFLSEELSLTLHPRKMILQPATWPVSFLGQYIRPFYVQPSKRVIHHFIQAMRRQNKLAEDLLNGLPINGEMDSLQFEHLKDMGIYEEWHRAVNGKKDDFYTMQSVVNSYLGYLMHCEAFRLAHSHIQGQGLTRCLSFQSNMSKGNLYKWYKPKYIIQTI